MASSNDLGDLRQSYTRAALRRCDLQPPLELFQTWLQEAFVASLPEPYAMQLATSAHHRPSVRTVLLREYSSAGLTFYTNSHSHKGLDLTENPQAEALFFWPLLERQIRAFGTVSVLEAQEIDAYFARRPRDSQIAAHVSSPQSGVISSRTELEQRFSLLSEQWKESPIPRPDAWVGYRLDVQEWEFWQGRPGRLHDRFRFKRQDDTWQIDRLMP